MSIKLDDMNNQLGKYKVNEIYSRSGIADWS